MCDTESTISEAVWDQTLRGREDLSSIVDYYLVVYFGIIIIISIQYTCSDSQ